MSLLKFFLVCLIFAVIDTTWKAVFRLPEVKGWKLWVSGFPDFLFGVVVAKLFF